MKNNKGLTLIETTIVLVIIILIGSALLYLLNPMKEIQRAQDTKRREEINILKKTYEDYYTDHKCYPKPTDICYKDQAKDYCPICGNKGGDIAPYLPALPCDPRSPEKEYLYQTDGSDCSQWYKIYAFLETENQDSIIEKYNYVVSSGNIDPYPYPSLANSNRIDQYACYTGGCTFCCYGSDCPPQNLCNQDKLCPNGGVFTDLTGCQANCTCP